MNIPDKAIEAAYAHRQAENGTTFLRFEEQQYILGILNVAGPAIAEQAWDEGLMSGISDTRDDGLYGYTENPYRDPQ